MFGVVGRGTATGVDGGAMEQAPLGSSALAVSQASGVATV